MTTITLFNSFLGVFNSVRISANKQKIDKLDKRFNFIQDDVDWIESNSVNTLYAKLDETRKTYETKLQELFEAKQADSLLLSAINDIGNNPGLNDPVVANIIFNRINNISSLLSLNANTIKEMFEIDQEIVDKLLNIIDEINILKLRFKLDVDKLSFAISDNTKLILKLSEQQMAQQMFNLDQFKTLHQDLSILNTEVDKKLLDIGLSASNVTGVILTNGTFKLAENLTPLSNPIFKCVTSVDSIRTVSDWRSSGLININKITQPTLANNWVGEEFKTGKQQRTLGDGMRLHLSNTSQLRRIGENTNIGLSLETSVKILLRNVRPERDGYLFLKGGGSSNIDPTKLLAYFIPHRAKYLNGGEFATSYGQVGSAYFPMGNNFGNTKSLYTVTISQKSDMLTILKVSRRTDYVSLINNSWATSANATTPELIITLAPPSSIMAGGDLIVELPQSFLSFEAIEFAQ